MRRLPEILLICDENLINLPNLLANLLLIVAVQFSFFTSGNKKWIYFPLFRN
ncbi:hypothetical protein HPS174_0948 [Glaesserella parasuis 174]|nr:hypothetical protein HPSSW114_0795 [Glaesserella parasuis SW114]EQA12890.1 hypothetical protein HPS174_0948 [Glaesserella parasuis 174]